MMIRIVCAALTVAVASLPSSAWGQRDRGGLNGPGMFAPGPPPFLGQVFSPRLVMENQQKIGLRSEQISEIKKAMNEVQQELTDLQWDFDAKSEALGRLLAENRVDEKQVLDALDEVTEIEKRVKKANFRLLVRIKNVLDPDQQATLKTLKPARGFRHKRGEPPE